MELDIDILISESQQEKKFEPISEIKPIKKIEALDPIQTMEAPKPEPMIKPKEVRQPEEISQPKIENNLAPSVMKRTIESKREVSEKHDTVDTQKIGPPLFPHPPNSFNVAAGKPATLSETKNPQHLTFGGQGG